MSVASPNRVLAPIVDEISPVHTQAEMATTMPQHLATRNNTAVYFSVGPNEPDIHWRAQQFANDGRLKLAIAQVESTIDDILSNISQRMLAHPAPDNDTIKAAIEAGFAKYRKTIQNLVDEPNSTSEAFNAIHFTTHLGRGKHLLEQLNIALHQSPQHFDCIMANMTEVARSMVNCAVAVANAFKKAQQNISLNAYTLKNLFVQQREQLVMQLLIQHTRKALMPILNHPAFVLREIHFFNALYNMVAPHLNIQPLEDEYVNVIENLELETNSANDEAGHRDDIDGLSCFDEVPTDPIDSKILLDLCGYPYVKVFCSELTNQILCQLQNNPALKEDAISHKTLFPFECFQPLKTDLTTAIDDLSKKYGVELEFNDFIWAYGDAGFVFPLVPPRLFCKITQALKAAGLNEDDYNLDIPGCELNPVNDGKALRIETLGGWLWLKTIHAPSSANPKFETTLSQPERQHWQMFLNARHISQEEKVQFLKAVLSTCGQNFIMAESINHLFAALLQTRTPSSACLQLRACFVGAPPVLQHQPVVHNLALLLVQVPTGSIFLERFVPHIKDTKVLKQIVSELVRSGRIDEFKTIKPLLFNL